MDLIIGLFFIFSPFIFGIIALVQRGKIKTLRIKNEELEWKCKSFEEDYSNLKYEYYEHIEEKEEDIRRLENQIKELCNDDNIDFEAYRGKNSEL